MRSQELIKLIRACSENGVAKLSFGNVSIEMDASGWRPTIIRPSETSNNNKNKIVDEESLKKTEEESILKGELDLREDQLAMMNLEDCVSFDKILQHGKLEV